MAVAKRGKISRPLEWILKERKRKEKSEVSSTSRVEKRAKADPRLTL